MSSIKVETLSQHQQERFTEFCDKWIAIGLSTEPAQREKAEAAIRLMYQRAKLPTPHKIVWCGSPLSQSLTRAIILDRNVGASVGASVRNAVKASVRDAVGDAARDAVRASAEASVRASGGNAVRNVVEASSVEASSVGASVRNAVRASVGASVRASVRDVVEASVRNAVEASAVGASVRNAVGVSVGDVVEASVGDVVEASGRDVVGASVRNAVGASGYGQHDAPWLSFYDYFREVCSLKKETDALLGLLELAKHAGWYLPHQHVCWVSERHHILTRDVQGRLHNLAGPSISYPDGWAIYAVHGVRVPEYIITRPQEISTAKIDAEQNIEIRRVMMEQYGQSRYLIDSKARIVHADKYGTLYRKEILNDEPLVMVKVTNSTPELDGSQKDYFLRVPSDMHTAHEAVAWTFRQSPEEYQPLIET